MKNLLFSLFLFANQANAQQLERLFTDALSVKLAWDLGVKADSIHFYVNDWLAKTMYQPIRQDTTWLITGFQAGSQNTITMKVAKDGSVEETTLSFLTPKLSPPQPQQLLFRKPVRNTPPDRRVTFSKSPLEIVTGVSVLLKGLTPETSGIISIQIIKRGVGIRWDGWAILEEVYSRGDSGHFSLPIPREIGEQLRTDVSLELWEFIGERPESPGTVQIGYDALTNKAFVGASVVTPLSVTGVPDEPLPAQFILHQNYPNPFNPETTISFSVSETSAVTLAIYNTLGQEVRTLVDGRKQPGAHAVIWDGKDVNGRAVPSGVYLYRLTAQGGFSQTKKMMLLK